MSVQQQPVSNVLWVPIDMVQANDYNPNSVANNELRLLYLSIKEDGFTQPIVTFYDEVIGKYIIVDGFHRHLVFKMNKDIQEACDYKLPIVVINKDIKQRVASTVRHNRARGSHAVQGMSNIVFKLLTEGWSDDDIKIKLGLEHEELIRLKHITGFSKLFADHQYSTAYLSSSQIKLNREWQDKDGLKHEFQ